MNIFDSQYLLKEVYNNVLTTILSCNTIIYTARDRIVQINVFKEIKYGEKNLEGTNYFFQIDFMGLRSQQIEIVWLKMRVVT